jgi:hypothetical protein
MNLPAYFFADLPPEAVFSPAMITASCHTLKRNREKFLHGRSTPEVIELLCEVAANWRDPGSVPKIGTGTRTGSHRVFAADPGAGLGWFF